jgi:hypothetical protein
MVTVWEQCDRSPVIWSDASHHRVSPDVGCCAGCIIGSRRFCLLMVCETINLDRGHRGIGVESCNSRILVFLISLCSL